MKVIKNKGGKYNRDTYYAVVNGCRISDGYPRTTPAAARRLGEERVAQIACEEAARKTGKYSEFDLLLVYRQVTNFPSQKCAH